MADLIYSAITSLDGYVEDKDGKFDAAPAMIALVRTRTVARFPTQVNMRRFL
jgi:hypothetical protein